MTLERDARLETRDATRIRFLSRLVSRVPRLDVC